MKNLNEIIDRYIGDNIVGNIAVRVGIGDRIILDTFRGQADKYTLFDMASVTKIIATTSLALIAIDRGLLSPEDPVDKFYRTEKSLTIRHLLTHTCGIGHKSLLNSGNNYENIAEKILEIPSDIPIGTEVRYSCPGFILLGKILEKIFGKRLDESFCELVAKPLGMKNTSFLPNDRQNAVNSNLDDAKRGMVNDYNCAFLGGVAGNAGMFSNIEDVTRYVHLLQNKGAPLVSEKTFLWAVKNYTEDMSESRGLGFLYVDKKYSQTGGLFEDGAIGHCGHTGQSVFVDYRTGLYVIILSDATVSTVKKYGEEHYGEVMAMRAKIHDAIKKDISYI